MSELTSMLAHLENDLSNQDMPQAEVDAIMADIKRLRTALDRPETLLSNRPELAVDIIIMCRAPGALHGTVPGVVLIKRKYEPFGWALPGGKVELESCREAAVREAMEETSLVINITKLHGEYSKPGRDPRKHMVSVVYVAMANGIDTLQGKDDAREAKVFPLADLPELAFDHAEILADYKAALPRYQADVPQPQRRGPR